MKRAIFVNLGLSILILLGSFMIVFERVSAAGSASLYLSPACGSVYNGNSIAVDIHENSGSTEINAIQTDLNYSTSQFNLISVTVASAWTEVQNDTSTPGTILFAAYPSPPGASLTGDQVVATAIFQAKNSGGAGSVSFANSSAVIETSDSQDILTSSTGATYPQALAHTCGSLVKSPGNPNVYLITDGTKHPIPAANIFVSQGFNWNWISTMTTEDQALPTGPGVSFRDGTLVKGSGAGVYVIDNTSGSSVSRAITSLNVFLALGYNSSDIINVADGQLPPSGSPISSAVSHPSGSLVSGPNGAIYLISGSTKRYIGSVYILYTYGYNYYQVKSATSADLALANGDNMAIRPGVIIKGSGPDIFVTDSISGATQKHRISSMAIFTGLGYSTGQIIYVPDSVLPVSTGAAL